jgi:hypothetical protein
MDFTKAQVKKTGRRGEGETRGRGDTGMRRSPRPRVPVSPRPRLPVSLSPCLPVSLSPCLRPNLCYPHTLPSINPLNYVTCALPQNYGEC